MFEKWFYAFIQAWAIGLIALIVGRYVGRGNVKMPPGIWRIFLVFLMVWTVTYIGKLAFSFLGHTLQWSESAQTGFAEFLLPLAAGAYFARQVLRRSTWSEASATTPE
jgi:hypothetical protein